jgi:hypothetical protein
MLSRLGSGDEMGKMMNGVGTDEERRWLDGGGGGLIQGRRSALCNWRCRVEEASGIMNLAINPAVIYRQRVRRRRRRRRAGSKPSLSLEYCAGAHRRQTRARISIRTVFSLTPFSEAVYHQSRPPLSPSTIARGVCVVRACSSRVCRFSPVLTILLYCTLRSVLPF